MPTEIPPQSNDMEKAQLEQELKTIEKGIKFAKTRDILEKYLTNNKGKSFESKVKKLVAAKYDELVEKGVISDKKKEVKKFKEQHGIDATSLDALSDESLVNKASPEPVASAAIEENVSSPEKKISDELAVRGFTKKSLTSIVKKYGSDTEQKLHASGKTYEEYKTLKPAEKKAIFETTIPTASTTPATPVIAPEIKNNDAEKEKVVQKYHYLNDMLFGKNPPELSVTMKAAFQAEWNKLNTEHPDIVKAEIARAGIDRGGFRINNEEDWKKLKGLGYTAEDAIKWTKYEYQTIVKNSIKKGDPIPPPIVPKAKQIEPIGKILSAEQVKTRLDLKDRGFPYEYIKGLAEDAQKNLAASNFTYKTFQELESGDQSAVFRGEKKFEQVTNVQRLAEIHKNYEVTDGDLDRILKGLDYDKKMLKDMNREEKMRAATAILEGGLTTLGYDQKDIETIPLRRQAVIVRLGTKKENTVSNQVKTNTPSIAKGPASPAKDISKEQKLDTLVDRGFSHRDLAENKFFTQKKIEQLYAWGGTYVDFEKMSREEREEKIFGTAPVVAAAPVVTTAPAPTKIEKKKTTEEDEVNFVAQKLFGYDEARIKRIPFEQKKNDIKGVLESGLLVLGHTPGDIEKMSLLEKFVITENNIKKLDSKNTGQEDVRLYKKTIQDKIEALNIVASGAPVVVSTPTKLEDLAKKEMMGDLINRGFRGKDLDKMTDARLQKLHAWGGSRKVFDKMSFEDAEKIIFNADHAPEVPVSVPNTEKKIDDTLLARGFGNWYVDNMSPEDKAKIHAWGGTRDVYEKMSQGDRLVKVFGEQIQQPGVSIPPASPTVPASPATPVPPAVPPAQGPRSKTPQQLETERLEREFQMTKYGASYLDKATGTVYFVEHASKEKDGSVLLECRLSNGGKGMLRKDKLLHAVEIGAYEQVDQQKFLEEQVNTTRTIYTTEYKENLNSSWWKKGVIRPLAGLGESLGIWRRDNKAFLSKEGENAKERYDAAKQELAKFADKRAKEKIVDPVRIKKIEDGLKRRAAAKGEKITNEQLEQEVNAILARYRRTILGHGIAIAETRKVHETQKGIFRSTTAETIGKAVKWYGGLSKASKFGIRAGVYTLAGISGMGAAAALGYGIYRGAKSVAMSSLIAQGTHLYRATIDKAFVGMSDSSLAKKKQALQDSIEKNQINILDYEKQMSNLGLKKNKHDAMRRTAQVGVAFALGWESYKVLDQLENTDWTITPTPGPIPDEGGVDDIDPVPPAPLPEPHPFHLDRPSVEFSSKGAIRTFLELKENLKDQLEDQHIALNDPNLPPSVKEILNGDPTELAIKYDYYNPADTNESALLTLHGKLGFDENMNLVHMEPNGDNTILADGYDNMKGDFNGKYIDSDYGSNIETHGSPAEELEKMKIEGASINDEGVPIDGSPAEDLKGLIADKLTPDEILAKSMGVDHVDSIEFDGPHANGSFIFQYDTDNNITGGSFEGDFKPVDLATSPYLRADWKDIVQAHSELPLSKVQTDLTEMLGKHATLEDVRANLPQTPDYDDERLYLDEKIREIDQAINKMCGAPVMKIELSQAQYDHLLLAQAKSAIDTDAEAVFGNKLGQWDKLADMKASDVLDKINYNSHGKLDIDGFSAKQTEFLKDFAQPLILSGNISPLANEHFGEYLARLEAKSPDVIKTMNDQYNLRA